MEMQIQLQVGVKILLKNKEGKYLFVKRSDKKYPGTQGLWDIIGGRINPGSTLLENLRREIKEETGLELLSLPKLIAAQDILRVQGKHIVRLTYSGETDGEPVLDDENTDYRWLNLNELQSLPDLDSYVKELFDGGFLRNLLPGFTFEAGHSTVSCIWRNTRTSPTVNGEKLKARLQTARVYGQ